MLADANGLVEAMKKAALDAMEAGKPANIYFGTVTRTAPLEINVEQKLVLGEGQLVLARNVTDFETEVTVGWETGPVDIDMSHSHEGSAEGGSVSIGRALLQDRHCHTVAGRKRVTVHNALAEGDAVLLARRQGGQQYIVLDRIGGMA